MLFYPKVRCLKEKIMLKNTLICSLLLLSGISPLSAQTGQTVSIPQITYLTIDFSQPHIQTHSDEDITTNIKIGPGTYFNGYYKNSWSMYYPGSSFIEITFDNQLDGGPTTLELCHLSSIVANQKYSPITILANDKRVVSNFSPSSGEYIVDTFKISECLPKGKNVIRIQFDYGAISNYWIQSLKVKFDG
jgi:hypothetical protein